MRRVKDSLVSKTKTDTSTHKCVCVFLFEIDGFIGRVPPRSDKIARANQRVQWIGNDVWCIRRWRALNTHTHRHTLANSNNSKKKLLYLSRFILKHVCNYIVCAYRRLQTHIHTIAPVWACHTNSSKALHGYAKNNHEIEEIRHFNVCVHLWCATSVSVLRARLFASFSLFLSLSVECLGFSGQLLLLRSHEVFPFSKWKVKVKCSVSSFAAHWQHGQYLEKNLFDFHLIEIGESASVLAASNAHNYSSYICISTISPWPFDTINHASSARTNGFDLVVCDNNWVVELY